MSWKMDINLSGDTFTDELHSDVGSSAFRIDHEWFIDLSINIAGGGEGTELQLGIDYVLSVEATDLSKRVTDKLGESKQVWGKVQIINATYQTGDLYFSGKYIADSVENADVNRPRVKIVDDADYTDNDFNDYDEIWINPATADRTLTFYSAAAGKRKKIVRNIGDGSYKVILSPAGTEKFVVYSGNEKWELTGFELLQRGDWAKFESDETSWVKVNAPYWHKIDDPATGHMIQKTSGWTADSFSGGLEVTFSDVPLGTVACECVHFQGGTKSSIYMRKSGDTNISNTPNASNEKSHQIMNANLDITNVIVWLSSDRKAQYAVANVDSDLLIAYSRGYYQ
jgi:hypothetical protein